MNLLSYFDKFTAQIPADPGVQALREKAVGFLNAKGLPTRKDEEWKYTSLKILNDESFLPATLEKSGPSHETIKIIREKLNSEFTNIVFHNGILNQTLSSVEDLPFGVHLKEAGTLPSSGEFKDSFEALNAAYFIKNYVLEVAPETTVKRPVNFVFYSSLENGPAVMTNACVTLNIGARSSLKFVESYCGQNDARYFVNSQIEVNVGDSAKLTYIRFQAESGRAINIGRTGFNLAHASQLHSLVYSTGAVLSRHNLLLELKSPEAFATVDGIYVVKDHQHVDNTTVIDHQVGACNTTQHYKGILADSSRAVFNGKVAIQKFAQKANSQQLNNNLLLSHTAEADSKPQLEIFADDVKAAHGSTVGQLNREELFYLESRAIAPEVAIPMLSYGYVSELIYKLDNEELQNWLNKELREAFKGIRVSVK